MLNKEDIKTIVISYINVNDELKHIFIDYVSKVCNKSIDKLECILSLINIINSLHDYEKIVLQNIDDSGINFNTQLQSKNNYRKNLLYFEYIDNNLISLLNILENAFDIAKSKFNNDKHIIEIIKQGYIYLNKIKVDEIYHKLSNIYENNQALFNLYYDIYKYNNWNIS